MKISISGYYYESSDNQVDPDGYNENASKKRDFSDKDAKGELERINCTFKQAMNKLYSEQKFENAVQKVEGEYKQIHQQLLLQCDVLNDLINGSIIGSRQICKQEISTYLQQIADIKTQLIQLESLISKKTTFNKHQMINKLNIITQEQQIKDDIDINLQMVDISELEKLQERVDKLNKKIGIQYLKKTQTGDSYYFRGQELFNGNEKVNEKKEKTDYNLIGQLPYQIQENDPQNIMAHIQLLKIQSLLLINDEATIQKLQKIQEQQDQLSKYEQSLDLTNQFQNIQKKHEFNLTSIDEIPKILNRLVSLKQLHQQTLYLPQQLDETSTELDWILESLQQGSEILDILSQRI